MKTYILIIRNALHVKSMDHNLLPPFIAREAGLIVNDVPRIHCGGDLTQESHCIISKGEVDLRIPLRLKGVFSYFETRKLTPTEIEECDQMQALCLTPDSKAWEPNDEVWAEEEEKYLDGVGNLRELSPTKRGSSFKKATSTRLKTTTIG